MVRRFADEVIRPVAGELDESQAGDKKKDRVFKAARKLKKAREESSDVKEAELEVEQSHWGPAKNKRKMFNTVIDKMNA